MIQVVKVSYLNILSLGKWMIKEFKDYRYGISDGVILEYIWNEGFIKLKQGYTVSKLLKESKIEEQLDALQKYKSIIQNDNNRAKNKPY